MITRQSAQTPRFAGHLADSPHLRHSPGPWTDEARGVTWPRVKETNNARSLAFKRKIRHRLPARKKGCRIREVDHVAVRRFSSIMKCRAERWLLHPALQGSTVHKLRDSIARSIQDILAKETGNSDTIGRSRLQQYMRYIVACHHGRHPPSEGLVVTAGQGQTGRIRSRISLTTCLPGLIYGGTRGDGKNTSISMRDVG